MKISISFGALAPSLAEQLDRTPRSVESWQKDADAIARLLVRGLLPESQGRTVRQKLLKRIARQLPVHGDDQ